MTNTNRNDVRRRVSDSIDELRRVRDQMRLEIHLARMEAKERWKTLEPRLHRAERFAKDVSQVSRRAMGEISSKLRDLRASLLDETRRENRN